MNESIPEASLLRQISCHVEPWVNDIHSSPLASRQRQPATSKLGLKFLFDLYSIFAAIGLNIDGGVLEIASPATSLSSPPCLFPLFCIRI